MSTVSKRILFVITSTGTGGSESMLRELVLGLDRERFTPSVCSLRTPGHVADELAAAGNTVFTLGLPDKPGVTDLASGVFRLARQLDEHRVDVVQSFLYRANFMSPLAARLSSAGPVVVSGHRSLAPLQGRVAVASARLIQRLADGVVANSEAVRDYLVANEGARRGRVEVIYNGVDLERFGGQDRSALRAELGWAPEDLVIGAVGRLEPVKGYDHLLQAVARLATSGRPMKLAFAGDGTQREPLAALARQLGIEGRVLFLGFRKDVAALYGAFDVFVLSSLREGFPNVVIEAMASGCPVVATRVGGVAEIVVDGQSGLVVEPASAESLTGALQALADDEALRHALAAGGRRRVEERFALARSIRAHEQLYERLANGRGTR